MTFDEMLTQARELLEREGRVSYPALKLRLNIADTYLEALKAELIDAKRLAVDEAGKVLVWVGAQTVASSQLPVVSSQPPAPDPQPPSSYTPPHLAARIRATSVTDGERKTITALFADLKGSTALIEGLDPEEARAIIDPALQIMMDAVHRYEGYVAQALGDGIFALFGAPIAHEDHPQRALYAALHMQEQMRRYGDTLRTQGYPPLLMRVGVNTGEVVLRSIRKDDLHADYVPVGHSTNLAARMEQLAAPGAILVTAHTHKLTDGYFEFKALGQTQVKGVEEPLQVYEVLGAGPLRTRLQVASRRGLTRFVGRQSEMAQLQQALAQAKAGHGQIVGVMGEPGLGKSRLFYEFRLTSQSGCLVLEAYSVSHGKASPYLPVIELLKSYFQLQVADDERTRRQKVIGKVLELDRGLEDTLPYLFALLGLEDQPAPLQQMDPQIRRRRTFDALKKLLLRESLNQPLMLIFEDLHWIDSETQGFLDTLSESVASARLLLLVNYRPEYRHEWGQKTYYTQLRLTPLGREEAEEFLDVLLGIPVGADLRVGPPKGAHPSTTLRTDSGAPLRDLKRLILEKTEGTPFFMEEVVQELFEQGVVVRTDVGAVLRDRPSEGAHPSTTLRTGSGAPLHIPPTVQGVLAARIDRLAPDEKALLQQLAVIGREFPLSLIRQVIPQPEAELYQLLSVLQHKEFLYEQPAFPEVEYIFKHALTQEVAYNSVLQERRKTLHGQTAQALEALYANSLDEHYSDLAHHYSRSGNTEKAVEYLGLAGQQAVQRSADVEAISHLTTALALLNTLPETPERSQQELRLQITLGPALIATKGYAAQEVEHAYTRARALCQQLGETLELFPVLWGLMVVSFVRAELQTTREFGQQLLHLASRRHDSTLLLEAHFPLGATLFHLGEFAQAREYLERGVALYDARQHHSAAFLYGGYDPGVMILSYTAWVLWFLGYADQSLKRIQEALSLAQKLSHPQSLAIALTFAAFIHQLRREGQVAQTQAEAGMAVCAEQGFSYWLAESSILRGWALIEEGQWEKGIVQIHEGVDARPRGTELDRSHYLILLAEGYGKSQQVGESLALLAEALDGMGRTGDCYYEAELYRMKGELTLQKEARGWRLETSPSSPQASSLQPPVSQEVAREAEACFHKAIETARKQQAKSLELRAATSLARLWQRQGKKEEARQMLAKVYGWFTEGFDTKDLQEAKALLDELS